MAVRIRLTRCSSDNNILTFLNPPILLVNSNHQYSDIISPTVFK